MPLSQFVSALSPDICTGDSGSPPLQRSQQKQKIEPGYQGQSDEETLGTPDQSAAALVRGWPGWVFWTAACAGTRRQNRL